MNYQRQSCRSSKPFIALLLAFLWHPAVLATDQWSNGSTDDSWERISRLQSVGRSAQVRSDFVTTCIESASAIERAAAVCWIARTSSVEHVVDLEVLLDDHTATVRRLAWNALLDLPDAKAAEVVLREIETKVELPPVNHYGSGTTGAMQFPEVVCRLSLVERKHWIAGLGEREGWIRSFAERRASRENLQFELSSSIIETADGLLLTVKPKAEVVFRANVSRHIQAATARESSLHGSNPTAKIARANGDSLQIKFSGIGASEQIPPGVYAVSLIPGLQSNRTAIGHFPFYVRVNRSTAQDQEIEQLLNNPMNLKSVERLGRLRSHRAVPLLIEYFMTTKDCEQAMAGTALATIGDERAARVFLQVPELSCHDSSVSSQSLLRELDPATQKVCSESLIEIGTLLLENWRPNLSAHDRLSSLGSIKLAFYNCERPLGESQAKIGEELISRLVDESRRLNGRERHYLNSVVSEFVIAYLGNESERIIWWLRAAEEDPELVLAFLREFGWPARMEQTGFEYSTQCLHDLCEAITQWKAFGKLTEEQKSRLDHELSHLKNVMRSDGR